MSKHILFFVFLIICTRTKAISPDSSAITAFINRYSQNYSVAKTEIELQLSNAVFIQEIIDKISKPAEKLTWDKYRSLFLTEDRIQSGLIFWKNHEDVLAEIEAQHKVDAAIVVALVGVETFYGTRTGKYRVLDALFTLAFGYSKRSVFFTKELESFLNLVNKGLLDIELKGSYAGAFGLGQFMPSSYEAYAKSFSGITNPDIVSNIPDGLSSVANYLKVHQWQYEMPLAQIALIGIEKTYYETQPLKPQKPIEYYENWGFFPSEYWENKEMVSLINLEKTDGNEYWFITKNFYAITRYNHSPLYAMAVFLLSEELKKSYKN